jgi:acyl-CoA thioesterase-1
MHLLLGARRARRGLLHFSLYLGALLFAGALAGPAGAVALAKTQADQAVGGGTGGGGRTTTREILVVGDSLSAEYGLPRGAGWVSLLNQRLQAERPGFIVANASISGDTTAGGLARLPPLLKSHPSVVVIALGGNDGLRGLPLADTHRNLDAMTSMAIAAGAHVVLVGIRMPPNYGRKFNEQMGQMYVDVANAHGAALVPFMLKGVADRPDSDDWFQPDHIHPVAKAHPIILDNIWEALQPLLEKR